MTIVAATIASSLGLTYLQLVQRLRQECGVSGSDPTTVQGILTRDIQNLANWINAAWMDIQRSRADWYFMRQAVTFTATPDLGRSYTPAQTGIPLLSVYKLDSFRNYPLSSGVGAMNDLPWIPYDAFRDTWLFGAQSLVASRPIQFTVDPHKNLLLGAIPSEPYLISGEGYVQASRLVNDNDYPSMPQQFHELVLYKAMMSYGAFENAPEVYDRGQSQYAVMHRELLADQAPQIVPGHALC